MQQAKCCKRQDIKHSASAHAAALARFHSLLLGSLSSPHLATLSCLYTSTPDHDYILDEVPGWAGVVVAGGGSGHAFKMGPAIGSCCAALAMGKRPPLDISMFAVDRFDGRGAGEAVPRK